MNGSEPQGRAPPHFGFAAGSTPSEQGRVAEPVPHPSVPDHELLRLIGRGSYGQVWLARNVMGAYRAVKVVYRSAFEHDRPFEREFEGIQMFEPLSRTHESQVDILHVGRNEQAGYFYYVMELADDQQTGQQINPETYAPKSLKSELYTRSRLPLEQCLQIGLSLTTALDHLHKHGLVHRDVKPSNIIFINEIPKLADIGLVASLDATMSFVGTAGYLPPEGPGAPQADIYSLGKVLYELCTGRDRQDFPELPTEWQKFVHQQGLLEFNAVLMKACATDVRKRYQTAADMHADLALLQAGKSVKRLRLVEQRLALITRIGLAAAALSVLALGGYFGAVRQARRAEHAENEMAQQLYAADINRASQFWEKGNLKRALELLESHRPASKTDRDLRGFEWFYFWRLCHNDDALLTWRAGTNGTQESSISPDAKFLVTSGQTGPLMLWDIASKQTLALTNYNSDSPGWAFSSDGNMLAYSSPYSIQLWDIQRKQFIAALASTNHSTTCLAFAPGNHLLAVADAESAGISLWDVDAKSLIGTLPTDRGGYISGLAFSSDGKILAAGYRDNVLTFWDPSSRSKIGDFDLPVGFASLLVFSPDNRILVVAGNNSIVVLCDVNSRKITRVLSGHEGQANDVAFSPDGRMFATASDDTTVKLWDRSSLQPLATFKGHLSPVNSVVFSRDSQTLFSSASDGVVKQWATGGTTNADILLGHTNWARSVAFSPDGKTLASAGKDKTVRLWDVPSGRPLPTLLTNERPVLVIAWSTNGHFLASGSGLITEPDGLGEVKLWDVVGRKGYVTLTNQSSPVRSLAFSPDSQTLATGNGNGALALWDVLNQRLKVAWVAHSDSVTGLAFSPDGKFFATCSDDNTVKVWDMKTRRCLAVLPGSAEFHNGTGSAFWCVAFSADGKLVAAGHDDGIVMLWSVPALKLLRTLKGTTGKVMSVAFSPEGRTLATGNQDNVVTLWHLATGQEMVVLHGHQGFVESVAFSPDGTILASASEDNTLRLWRAATLAEADTGR